MLFLSLVGRRGSKAVLICQKPPRTRKQCGLGPTDDLNTIGERGVVNFIPKCDMGTTSVGVEGLRLRTEM